MRRFAAVMSVVLVAGVMAAAKAPAAEPDYSGYAKLLDDYLARAQSFRSGARDAPAVVITAFDYERLRARGDHAGAGGYLSMIRRQLLTVPPSRMTAAERTAWGINVYNFLVIEQVVHHLGSTGGKLASVMDVKDFFEAPVVEVEGVSYSLNGFERHFLLADFERKSDTPPPALDPRVHFGIVCAARGCPPLGNRPYRSASLDRDLDHITRLALRSRSHLRMDPKTDRFAISSIFDWYEKDFGGRAGVMKFLRRHGPTPLKLALGSGGADALRGFIPWDWRLNRAGDWVGDAQP